MAPLREDSYSGSNFRFKSKNKDIRHAFHIKQKKAFEAQKREARFRRRKEENKDPKLRAERRTRNVPATIDGKRVWDDLDVEDGDGIGLSLDLDRLKRQKIDEEQDVAKNGGLTEDRLQQLDVEVQERHDELHEAQSATSDESDLESLMEDSEDAEGLKEIPDEVGEDSKMLPAMTKNRAASPTVSATSTSLSLIPDALAAKYPTLFTPPETPKILITTSMNSTLHSEAVLLTGLFPNCNYVPRTKHRYNAHHFSIREISKFASHREYTTLLVLTEDKKRPSGLTVVHLPAGPTFHFSISNWVEGKKLPGHGNATDHHPELILNNFRTPLGLLTAHLFRTMFPPQPEVEGRQVVTLHNQRDYIFVRRHRYIFRDKRATEKSVIGTDGKPVKGVEDIRAGLQELGPRFTLKLRRIDKGIQRASGQDWEWKGGMEKQRTKFQL